MGVINRVIRQLHRDGKTAVVISAQLPYDVACYPEADALLVSYCSGPMKTVPNASGAGSAWVPNLPAAICAAFGVGEPAGSLPVDVPALDADFHLTPTVLYSRRTEPGRRSAAAARNRGRGSACLRRSLRRDDR